MTIHDLIKERFPEGAQFKTNNEWDDWFDVEHNIEYKDEIRPKQKPEKSCHTCVHDSTCRQCTDYEDWQPREKPERIDPFTSLNWQDMQEHLNKLTEAINEMRSK